MNRAPAFQFYPKDWLDFRVQRMSLEAQGAYLKLLCFMWADSDDQCSVIDNNDLLARAIGTTVETWLKLRTEIQCESDQIFEEKRGRLVSARLRHEAGKQRKYQKLQAEKGKRSAQIRFNRGSAVVEPEHQRDGNSFSSSSLKRETHEEHRPHSADPRPTSNPIGKKKSVLVPMPDEFTISESVWAWANKQAFPRELVDREFETFCNDRLAKGVQYADWDRAFMTWLSRQGEFLRPRRNGHATSTPQRRKEPLPL